MHYIPHEFKGEKTVAKGEREESRRGERQKRKMGSKKDVLDVELGLVDLLDDLGVDWRMPHGPVLHHNE
jgi:hypothetical protein